VSIAFNSALSALGALGIKFGVAANNVANVNTDGFKKSRAHLQDNQPAGVTVSISKLDTPGFPLPAEDGSLEPRESSNVKLEEETVDLLVTKRAYLANVNTLKREEETIGTLLDVLSE
jgi:flagellar basal-body rod protein FlgC